jgi:SAM-dependent methyltransferase
MHDARQHSPAADRNQASLLQQLQRLLPAQGRLLEIASGTGQHAAHFARQMPGWHWQPSDATPAAHASITAWCSGLENVAPALVLDVLTLPWPVAAAGFDAVFCANMLHIAPWPTCAALMQGASRCLSAGGLLLVYGPFIQPGVPTAPSNTNFDIDLRARNPAWGLRELPAVVAQAQTQRLALQQAVPMPANNLLLVFALQPGPGTAT